MLLKHMTRSAALKLSAVPMLLAALAIVPFTWAQQPAGPSQAADAGQVEKSEQAEEGSAARPFRGRLPNYYAAVVTPQQRERIYAIQAEYAAQIEALQRQLDDLRDQQATAVAAVLMPEQLQEVERLRAEAAAKRGAMEENTTDAVESDTGDTTD